ncbi:MAG: VTT domain-containing protein, partial [Oscillospiraceae bacterium]
GEFVEIISGLLYGTVGGYLICTVGMIIGTVIIYYTVKSLGYSAINKKLGDGKLSKFKFLNDANKIELLVFILFFIPGTPKDLLTYFMPFVKIKASKFFFLSTIARIPTIVSSTFAGSSISQGKWGQTVLVFVAIGVFSIAGIIVNNILTKRLNQKNAKKENKLV